ncbi:uncharacterized protein K441DRAFT_671785 [Cenococcum geophilum 1.58]|uniref:Uncharacterized protein n=1 Tax=Cenococcum geophilum 1.58 TaxID=794803 RepID=A0ACC8EKP5_9PEZI|nr:hypothetical protein K441DRAFT_671785 [Cenococcum geophilum 1.58]
MPSYIRTRVSSPPPALDNPAFATHISHLQELMTSFPVKAKEVSEDQEQNQVIIWATSKAEFHKDLKDARIANEEWAYGGEYIFILAMDETGQKVGRVIEFVYSKGTERLRGLMMRARANKAQREKAAQT